jgi:hypothetical protein
LMNLNNEFIINFREKKQREAQERDRTQRDALMPERYHNRSSSSKERSFMGSFLGNDDDGNARGVTQKVTSEYHRVKI